jgi:hypothetical protein
MKTLSKLFALLFVSILSYKQANALNLLEAINNKALKISFENKGGYSGRNTELTIVNNSKLPIEINNKIGSIISSEDSSSQNLIIADEIVAIIKPKESFIKKIATYCISPRKSAPHQSEYYFYKSEAEPYLLTLLQFIVKNQSQESDNQNAIWAYVNGTKSVFLNDMKNAKNIALKNQLEQLYAIRLKEGLIFEDKQIYNNNFRSYVIEGTYDLFVKEKGMYSANLVDSLGNKEPLFQNKTFETGMIPVRYLHNYNSENEKAFYISISKDNKELLKAKLSNISNTRNYVRYRVKSKTVFNIRQDLIADLDVTDSAGNIYINYIKGQKMYPGIRSFDFSFNLTKPKNTNLYLAFKDQAGKLISKQLISDKQSLKALQGYAYVNLPRRLEGTFGLYDSKNNLIEEFKTDFFPKGLQMLAYGFMFDTESKETMYLKIIDKNSLQVVYEEKVFAK